MNVIELFRNDLWNGIWQHAKRLMQPMLMPTIITVLLNSAVLYLAYLIIKPMLPPEVFEAGAISSPEEITELMALVIQSITENQWLFMGKMFIVTVLMAAVTAWYYNAGLQISKQTVENNDESFSPTLSNSFGDSFIRMLGFALIMAVASTIASVINNAVQSITPGLAFLVNIVIQIFILRFFAGRAWIVMGDQTVVDGLKLSWENITFVRALKLFLIFLVGGIAIALALGLIFGLSMFLGKAGIVIFMVVMLLVMYIVSVVGISGLSASFYRYVEVEYETSTTADEHIIDSED
ncbi:MAG: hypothetical protein ACI8SE_002082 [Bacteroidia bacterium]|jgi:hypothetical protein